MPDPVFLRPPSGRVGDVIAFAMPDGALEDQDLNAYTGSLVDHGGRLLSVLVDGNACIAYLDNSVAMSARMYDRRTGGIGLFVGEGSATFTDVVPISRQESTLKEEI